MSHIVRLLKFCFQLSYLFGTCTFLSFLHNKTLLCFVPSKSDGWGRSIGVRVFISPKKFESKYWSTESRISMTDWLTIAVAFRPVWEYFTHRGLTITGQGLQKLGLNTKISWIQTMKTHWNWYLHGWFKRQKENGCCCSI